MKIIATNHAFPPLIGIASCFTAMQEEFLFWDKNIKSSLDMFDEVKPDILICTEQDLDEGIHLGLKERNTKLILMGDVTTEINAHLIINKETDDHNVAIRDLANPAKFCNGVQRDMFNYDILYISDLANIENSLVPGILGRLTQHRLLAVGQFRVPIVEYAGNIGLSVLCDMMKSVKLGIDFFKTHYLDYAINRVCCLSADPTGVVPEIDEDNFQEIVKAYIESSTLREVSIDQAYEYAKNNTYFHFVSEILEKLGFDKQAKKSLEKLESILNV